MGFAVSQDDGEVSKLIPDFLAGSTLERLPMKDADILLCQQFELDQSYNQLLQQLIDTTSWCQETISVYGKPYLQPRLSAWYGNGNYSYSGITLHPAPWAKILLNIKTRVELLLGHEFNSVLLNYYRDQNDSMGMHSDNEAELGKQPVIASLSLGDERTFLLKHKTCKQMKTIKIPLISGSLLVMRGDTQTYWRHGLAKEKAHCGPRVNLTFRMVF